MSCDPIQKLACDIAYENDPEGEWTGIDRSYGSGGYTIDREKLSKLIAYALAHAPNPLLEPLTKLISEINALKAFETEIRLITGNTNFNVLNLRIIEAENVLAKILA